VRRLGCCDDLWALSSIVLLFLSACAVGPNFKHPVLPAEAGYTTAPLRPVTVAGKVSQGTTQTFLSGLDIPGDWWSLFGSKGLSDLVIEAMNNNPDVTAAQATLQQANQTAYATRGSLFPSISAKDAVQKIRFSGAVIGQPYDTVFSLKTSELSLSYTLDIFGGTRRQVESAVAQRFQLEATYLTLSSNVVVAAIQDASLRAQIAATEEILNTKRNILGTVERQLALGGASGADVLAQESSLAQTSAALPSLEHSLAVQRDLLAVLVGHFPNDPPPETFDFESLQLPDELPVSLPSNLVEQRPDIRASEALLHAATAQVGVATANMLPQLSISASIGSISLGQLFDPGSAMSNLGANLTQPLFQGGQLWHQRRAAQEGLLAAAAQYRSTVLTAFKNVADVLAVLQTDGDVVAAQAAAEQASAADLRIVSVQYESGATSFINLLNAQSTLAQTKVALIQAEASRYTDTAALYQALGGGWWNRADVSAPKGR
jgi:NodT family efflux transporter outer membrane factor (OMF) lipoprotein